MVQLCSDLLWWCSCINWYEERTRGVGALHVTQRNFGSKRLQLDVNRVMQDAVGVVNSIKARALNVRLHKLLCNKMVSDHDKLLVHTK
jgi:hypothetical protein